MSKGPTPRHSKSPAPVTIDLDATDVTPKDEPGTAKTPTVDQAAAKAVETAGGAKPGAVKADAAKTGSDTKTDAKPSSPGSAKPAAKGPDAVARSSGETGKPKTGAADSPTSHPAAKPAEAAAAQASATRPTPGQSASGASKAASAPAAPNKRGGGVGMIAAGLVGAVIALGGYYALQSGGLLPAPGGPGGNDEQTQTLASRIDGLASTVEALSTEVAAQPGGDGVNAELLARVESLESASSQAGSAAAAASSQEIEQLTDRLDELDGTIAALDASGGDGADPALAATVQQLSAGQSGLDSSLSELQSQSAALSEKVAAIEQDQAELSRRLEERLATLEARLDEPAQQVDLARAIAAAGLKSAIDRGGSFMSELEAFASVAPDDPAVPELRNLAASGVPSRSELIERFPDAANQAITAANPGDPNAGLVDRLMSSALSVVKVRKVGEVEGDSAEAIAARAEARLMDGDPEAALAEWQALPETSRAAASDYGAALAARVRAEKLIAASLAPGGSTSSADTPSDAATDAPAN